MKERTKYCKTFIRFLFVSISLALANGCTLNSRIISLESELSKPGIKEPDSGTDKSAPIFWGPVAVGNTPDDLSRTPVISFLPATDNQSGISHYEVQILKSGVSIPVLDWTSIVSGNAVLGLNPTLVSGQSYFARVRAVDNAGNLSSSVDSSEWVAPQSATVSIASSATIITEENQSPITIQVSLTSARSVDTVIPLNLSGTATLGSDFSLSQSGTITILAGQVSATETVTLINDAAVEPIKYADFTLGTPGSSLVSLGSTTSRRLVIVDDDPDSTAMVVSGASHNCFKNSSGSVKCWGRNTWGQLGLGDTNDRGDQANEMGTSLPTVNLGTALTVAKLSAGNSSDNTCALFTNGKIKCWGRGDTWSEPGYMGYGHADNIGDQASDMGDNLPFISLGTGVLAKDLTTSSFNTCAITTDNKMKCWGVGFHGANGNASDARIGSSLSEMGDNLPYLDLGSGRKVLKVAMGSFHRCAILDNLRVKCWGWNTNGELGTEDLVTRGINPNEMGDNLPYVNLGTGALAVDITAATGGYFESGGVHHTCALLSSGQVKCWGGNGAGQLGYENTTALGGSSGTMGDNLPFVNLGTGRTAKRIFSSNFSTCAILDNDTLKCWGSGDSGQLGYNSTSNYGNISSTMGDNLPSVFLGTSRRALFVSGSFLEWSSGHRCALMDDYSVKCWGKNTYGELGIGNTNSQGDNPNEMQNLNPISIFFD